MGPRELAHRFREKCCAEQERHGLNRNDPETPAAGMNFKNYLVGAPARRFYCGQGENLREFLRERFPEWIERTSDEAERLCRHQLELLGYGTIQLGSDINWHQDPVTGRIWERRFRTDYRVETDHDGRDAKIIHELNRHQHLPRLAKAWHLTGDERYADEAVTQMIGWIDQNPAGIGINWQSSLETGVRSISWLWTVFLLLPSRSFDEARAQRIGNSLFEQLEHVYRNTSRFSSPNTLLIGEAAALFIAGLVFADRPRPAAWLQRGAELLVEQAAKQVLDDGVYGELSSSYHCYALDFFLQSLILAEQNEYRFPAQIRFKVEGMLEFLMHLTRPDGTIPMLGDDDGGRVLALRQRNYHLSGDALCLGAILFTRPDFKHRAGVFSEDALWFLGRNAWSRFSLLKSEAPSERQSFYPSAGYAIQRSGWGPLDSHLVFDVGGLGMFSGGHSHADSLSLVLFSQGREILVDPGTFVYNCAPEWRSYFRSTRAHNTVTVDGRDQAERLGTFSWKTRIPSRGSQGPGYVEGEHDGYAEIGVTHRRRLVHVAPEYWIVTDDFHGSGRHTFDFFHHFGPGIGISRLEQEPNQVVARAEGAGFLLGLFALQPIEAEILCGQTAPIGGWVSRGYGEKTPGPTLRTTLTGAARSAALTFLAPGKVSPVLRRLEVEGGPAIACSCRHDGFEDIVVSSTGETGITVSDLRLRGEFFWIRTERGVLKQSFSIGATCFELGGEDVREGALCAQFAGS